MLKIVDRSCDEVYFLLFIGFETEGRKFLQFFHLFLTILTSFCGIFINILVVWMRLFLGSTTFYPFFSWFFYDLVNFFVKNSRPIVWLGVFSTFYWVWNRGTKIFYHFCIGFWLFWPVFVEFLSKFWLFVCIYFLFWPLFTHFFHNFSMI